MSAPFGCPPVERWQAVFGDTLRDDERGGLERPLERCPACQERLDQAADCQDALLRLGRRLGDPTAAPDDPSLSQFLIRVQEETSSGPAAPAEPGDLDFLGP